MFRAERKERQMGRYMIEFSYKSEAVAALVKKPEDRAVAIGELISKMGGRLLDFYFTFGEYDGVCIAELPDNVAALAVDMAAVTPGHTSRLKTTVLLTPEEATAAMRKASGLSLRPPGA
jgi:uncharacterized protein with GYD domain